MNFLEPLQRALGQLNAVWKAVGHLSRDAELVREALGRIEARQCAQATTIAEAEFRVSSQWGEDGILQFLLRHVAVPRRVFVEFGVETYVEANTRFLLTNCGWSGLVLDGGEQNVAAIRRDPIYWRHNLKATCAFITRDNINELIRAAGLEGPIGLLSVDIDGNDYWVWEAITAVEPAIVVAEYNSLFGAERAVTVPYDPAFYRTEKDPSNLYYGASLAALTALGRRKGYALVGTNTAGNNAFYVRRELLAGPLRELTVAEAFTARKFREGRDAQGGLMFLDHAAEAAVATRLPLVEVAL
jgi:hypothetical protein